MKYKYVAALVVIMLGVLIMLVPYVIFPVCDVQLTTDKGMLVPMKCFWTARALLACGAVIVLGGILLMFTAANVGIMLLAMGLLVILFPNLIIGVCPGETMPCHMGTLPAATILGALVVLLSILLLIKMRQPKN